MKKRIFALLVAMLMLVSVLALTSCDVMSMLPDSITSLIPGFNGGDETCADGHADADGDEICDNCGASVPAQEPDDEPEGPVEELPEEPEREPTYQIKFNFHGVVYENKLYEDGDNKGLPIMDSTGKPERISKEQDVTVYTLDVLQNQAPTAEQLAEIPGITYGGITVVGWYDSPELKNEVDFTEVLTADKNVYAKLKISEADKKGNGYCGDKATWKLTSKGTLKIEGSGAMYDFTYPEIAPWYFNENGEKNVIIGVEVGDNITHIGAYSFYNIDADDVENIEIGEGVTSIGAYAFAYSTLLKSAPLTENIEYIGTGAFEGCRRFNSINIPDSVQIIDGYAFYSCTNFEYVVLGTGLQRIGEAAFNQVSGKAHKYIYYRGTAEEYENVIIQMGNDAFYTYGAYLYFYTAPDSPEAKTAGQYWTYDSSNNPKPLSYTIRYYVPSYNSFPVLTDFVFIDADKTGTYSDANKAAMEAIVYRGYKFASWDGLDKYLNGTKLTNHVDLVGVRGDIIGDKASYHFNPTTGVLTINGEGDTWDFEGTGDTVYFSQLIKKVVFEPGITGLGANVLGGITSLVTVELPDTIKTVHPKAFAGCTKLAAIYYMGDSLEGTGLDSLVETNANAYAKAVGDIAGKEGAFWQDKSDGVRLAWSFKNGILTIGGDDVMPDFEKGEAPWLAYDNVKEIVFASNIKTLGENSFAGLKSVEKLTLHNKLVNIPRSAFEGSAYWNNEANWQNGALMAGAHLLAFDTSKMADGATFATIPQATKIITAEAFKDCGSITSLVLPAYIDNIDETAFDGLTGLKIIYYYGQNENAWNSLPAIAAGDLIVNGAKILYRAAKDPADTDPYCNATGMLACPDCTKEGKVDPNCTICRGTEKIQCYHCSGTGHNPNPEKFWRMVSKVPTPWNEET